MKVLIWRLKVCHSNFATSKSIKTHIIMKKILSLILVMVAIALQSIAQEPNNNSSSQSVELEFHHKNNTNPTIHRAPMRMDIEAYYNAESHTIDIYYDGEAAGEVFIYLNETIIGYDSQINTSLPIPATPGLYRIEILGETWIAQGYIQL